MENVFFSFLPNSTFHYHFFLFHSEKFIYHLNAGHLNVIDSQRYRAKRFLFLKDSKVSLKRLIFSSKSERFSIINYQVNQRSVLSFESDLCNWQLKWKWKMKRFEWKKIFPYFAVFQFNVINDNDKAAWVIVSWSQNWSKKRLQL